MAEGGVGMSFFKSSPQYKDNTKLDKSKSKSQISRTVEKPSGIDEIIDQALNKAEFQVKNGIQKGS